MLHLMLDAYKCTDIKLNNMLGVYNTISKISDILGVSTIMPPLVIPYYYGQEQADDGISAFVLLKGGHFTIHTFPERECYFVDLLCQDFISEKKFQDVFFKELPFESFKINNIDRRFNIDEQRKKIVIDENKDFGPHYLIRNKKPITLDINKIYTFLDQLPPSINMTPIMRPVVITDNAKLPAIISGITMIAQSHIALHYTIKERSFYSDIFSCSFIDCIGIQSHVERELDVECEIVLISRGSKHQNRLATRGEIISRFSKWRDNI